jgi:DNA-binding NtrC family response regulator
MRRLCEQIESLARRQCTALLQGESGTGKELTARLIHESGPRAAGPFVPVDCTTLRDALFESQLFGHTRGAFTGADRATLGFFRAADGGTLFLDEIGELAPQSQAKLLRTIQERKVVALGAVQGTPVDVRVIAATHRDLSAMVRAGEFRQDLYYRLNVACLRLPPLRDRLDDLPLLIGHALDDLAALYQEPRREVSPGTMEVLRTHDWPGNVRELINAIEHALVFARPESGDIRPEDLPEEVVAGARRVASGRAAVQADPPAGVTTLEHAERQLIAAALRASGGNQSRAAQVLDVERHRLHRRIVHHGLTDLLRPGN